MSKKRAWILTILLAIILLIWLNLSSILRLFIFQPVKLPENHVFHFDPPFEEIFLTRPDGSRLNGIWFPKAGAKATVLYFHGNRDNVERWGKIASQYTKYDVNVLVMDYRGYGKSRGKIDEELLKSDAILWYKKAIQLGQNERIILFGRSLGTGLASYVASRQKPLGLILETPYTSMVDVLDFYGPKLVAHQSDIHLDAVDYLKGSVVPTIIIHGTADEIIPYEIGKTLFEHLDPLYTQMVTIKGGQHNNLGEYKEYWDALKGWFEIVLNKTK